MVWRLSPGDHDKYRFRYGMVRTTIAGMERFWEMVYDFGLLVLKVLCFLVIVQLVLALANTGYELPIAGLLVRKLRGLLSGIL